ncbi:MAG: hypothetical protein ACFFD2_24610 [Promethearchaeota archaeon]
MSNRTPRTILLRKMDELLQADNPVEIELKEEKVVKFYEITYNEEWKQFQERNIISPEYLMTLFVPIGTKVIVNVMGGMKDLPKIVGVIHTNSEVNYLKPIYYGRYNIISKAESLQKKKGEMGEYLVFTFKMSLFSQGEEEVANDIHQFFLRLGKEEN